jgi:hypothetical protein
MRGLHLTVGAMRLSNAILACSISLGLWSCSQQSKEHTEREAGKAAYHAAQVAKTAAAKAGREMRVAGEQAYKGWKQAQRDDQGKKK